VLADGRAAWSSEDLRHWPPAERELEVKRQAAAVSREPFLLEEGPLLRARLLRVEPERHMLLVAVHHIVFDGWSMGVFLQELSALYAAYASGETPRLAEPALQYRDFASWQRETLQGERLEQLLDYWSRRLEGAELTLELPTSKPRPPVQRFRGRTWTQRLGRPLIRQVEERGRAEGATLFMLLLAAFKTLLYRYTGQTGIAVGTPIAGRTRVELEEVIGLVMNSLVLYTDLTGEPTFRELVGRVKETAIGAYAHQELPFEKLVDRLQPERDLSRSPLFQVMFVLQNAPMPAQGLPGVEMQVEELDSGTAKYDLTLRATESEQGLVIAWEYDTELFEQEAIERMAGHYETLLAGIAADPDCRIGELPMLTPGERIQLQTWNATSTALPQVPYVHKQFEAQAAATPEAEALVFEGETLTYEALNRRANQLASYLLEHAAEHTRFIGVYMDRSLELVVSLLAILKAGKAYVPVDPGNPAKRVEYMLADAELQFVVTDSRSSSRLLEAVPRLQPGMEIVEVDRLEAERYDADNPACALHPQDPVYLIYTSGSTGHPKGAVNTHIGLANRLLWMKHHFAFTPDDCFLQKTPFGFDVSVWEFFAPLISGARLVVAKPEGHKDSRYLQRLIDRHRISVIHFVPSMLHVFLRDAAESETLCPSLRHVFCSGEALSLPLVQLFCAKNTPALLHNLYGPTEAAIDVTSWTCPPTGQEGAVPIGRPVWNTTLHVLDERLQQVPIGVVGELYIGGVQVAKEYYGRPELTRERFIAHPLAGEGVLYRTGDLVRYRPDGQLEYIGREDNQIKLRGFRVELGEIEAAIVTHETIAEAVVTVWDAGDDDRRLVAYVAAQGGHPESVSQIRRHLAERLPEYMIPSIWVMLDRLPLSRNGKVDKRALPDPLSLSGDALLARQADECAALDGPIERVLADIFAEVLKIGTVSPVISFFEQGGNSLLATQVTARIKQWFQFELPLLELFQHPTVRGLAEVLMASEHRDRIAKLAERILELTAMSEAEAAERLKVRSSVGEGVN